MKRIAIIALLLASPAFAIDLDMRWYDTPGEWLIPGYIDPLPFFRECPPQTTGWCASFVAQAYHNSHSPRDCLRYEDVYVLRDGERVPGIIEEEGAPGEPGWVWRFRTAGELWAGPFQFHVKTIDVCPKVG